MCASRRSTSTVTRCARRSGRGARPTARELIAHRARTGRRLLPRARAGNHAPRSQARERDAHALTGRLKILDFGLALVDADHDGGDLPRVTTPDPHRDSRVHGARTVEQRTGGRSHRSSSPSAWCSMNTRPARIRSRHGAARDGGARSRGRHVPLASVREDLPRSGRSPQSSGACANGRRERFESAADLVVALGVEPRTDRHARGPGMVALPYAAVIAFYLMAAAARVAGQGMVARGLADACS